MGSKHEVPAVVTAMNVNGLAVARVLGRAGVPVIGVASDLASAETKTRFVRELWRDEAGPDGHVDLLLEKARGLPGPAVLFPITDASVQAVAARQDELRRYYRFGMPASDLVRTLLDKRGFGELAERLSLPAPRSYFVHEAGQMPAVAERISYPCILKPQVKSAAWDSAGAKKAYVIENRNSLLEIYGSLSGVEPRVILQEYIPGTDADIYFCLQYYDARSEPLASFTGHKLRQWPPHCGGTSACEPVDAPEVERLSEQLFRQVSFRGLCSMEFKRDPRNGSFQMIEPTVCRTDWQSALADINGVPIPYVAYCDLLGLPIPRFTRRSRPIRWTHLGSDRLSAADYRSRGELGLLAWLWSIRPPVREAILSLDDPGPMLDLFRAKLRAKAQRVGRWFHRSRDGSASHPV